MAISAMLLLSPTMVQAQEVVLPTAAPPAVSPPAVSPAAEPIVRPTIVLPVPDAQSTTIAQSPAPSTPVAEPVDTAPALRAEGANRGGAATSAPVSRVDQPALPTQARSAQTGPTSAGTAPATTPATAPATSPATPAMPEVAQDQAASALPEETPFSAPPVAAETSTNPSSSEWAIPVGLGASLLVLGGIAMARSRRRRPYEEDVNFIPPVITRPTHPATHPATRPATRPAMSQTTATPQQTVPERLTASITTHTAATKPHDDLLERMVAAAPDARNPFISRKARRRRARLILQSMPDAAGPQTQNPLAQAESAGYVHARFVRVPEHA